jgi:hypothetical protein
MRASETDAHTVKLAMICESAGDAVRRHADFATAAHFCKVVVTSKTPDADGVGSVADFASSEASRALGKSQGAALGNSDPEQCSRTLGPLRLSHARYIRCRAKSVHMRQFTPDPGLDLS